MLEYRYPEGKRKALTFSYDDGQTGDRRLVGIFNDHGLKGTFHLNDAWFDGDVFITSAEVATLYKGHEIACHGVVHKHPMTMSRSEAYIEYSDNRRRLEQLSNTIVRGLSYAYGEYSDMVIDTARACGIAYSRTVNSTKNFHIPADFMMWHPTTWHGDPGLNDLIDCFKDLPSYEVLPLFYIWGHSFEFDRGNNWNIIEDAADRLAGDDDTWYATNIEIYDYITAIRSLVYSTDGKTIYNPSAQTVWGIDGNKCVSIPGGAYYHAV